MGYQMVCVCDKFKKSMIKIAEAQFFAYNHGIIYDGDVFEFCPWCSKPLERNELVAKTAISLD